MAEQAMPLTEALALVEREAKAINNGLYGRLALALSTICAAVRELQKVDWMGDADDWEFTYSAGDFADALSDSDADKRVVRVKRFHELPTVWWVRVTDPQDDDCFVWREFATEAEALAVAESAP